MLQQFTTNFLLIISLLCFIFNLPLKPRSRYSIPVGSKNNGLVVYQVALLALATALLLKRKKTKK